jgi:ferredoxin--NADP+ reductase
VFKIILRETLGTKIHLFKIEAPAVVSKARAGQFVIVRVDEKGERIPLTIADWDSSEGSITLVFMEVGAETTILATKEVGEFIADLAGPLGMPSEIDNFGTVVCVGGGIGLAPIMPIARALKQAGNRVISIIGARSKDLLFWEEKVASVSDKLIVTTNDGSYARKALVTEPLNELLQQASINRVVVVGPAIMMRVCCETTKPFGVKTIVSLNPIMVDGTGMCGCCRVVVGGVTKFACVDGPEFDGHEVDWPLLMIRQGSYHDKESESFHFWKEILDSREVASNAKAGSESGPHAQASTQGQGKKLR